MRDSTRPSGPAGTRPAGPAGTRPGPGRSVWAEFTGPGDDDTDSDDTALD